MNETERGNMALTSGDGAEILWVLDENNTAIMEVSFCANNYPAWNVTKCNIPEKELAKHINENLQAWYIRRNNIEGINVDLTDNTVKFIEEE